MMTGVGVILTIARIWFAVFLPSLIRSSPTRNTLLHAPWISVGRPNL
jgi:hypothetical protein